MGTAAWYNSPCFRNSAAPTKEVRLLGNRPGGQKDMDEERAICEFLGERPRAEQLGEWLAALRQRLASLEEEAKRVAAPGMEGPQAALQAKIAQLRLQIRALAEEAAITEFVEDSVRVTLAMGAVAEGAGEDN